MTTDRRYPAVRFTGAWFGGDRPTCRIAALANVAWLPRATAVQAVPENTEAKTGPVGAGLPGLQPASSKMFMS